MKIHKIWHEGEYTLSLYIVRNGGYWWGVYPKTILLPNESDYVDEGCSAYQADAWKNGREALDRWAEKPEGKGK